MTTTANAVPGVHFGTHGPLPQAVLKLEVTVHGPTAARAMLPLA